MPSSISCRPCNWPRWKGDEWRKHNDPIPLEAVLADFGLNMDDWEKMGQPPAPDEPNGKG
ncbi:MAG: hypothetical protein ABSH56_31965 [Bryobacteraceae bacterium]